jgi:hypothetical protein
MDQYQEMAWAVDLTEALHLANLAHDSLSLARSFALAVVTSVSALMR